MFPHWQYLLEDLFGPVSAVYARRGDAPAQALGRGGRALRGDRRRRRLRGPRVRRRRDRVGQLLLGGPGQPPRAARAAGRRHPRQRGGGPAQLRRPAQGVHPDAGLEPRPARPARLSGDVDRRARTTPSSTTGSRPSGSSSCGPPRCGTPFRWDLFAGARGVQLAELALRSSDEGRRVEIPRLGSGMTATHPLPGRATPLEIARAGLGGRLPAADLAARLRRRPRRLGRRRRSDRLGVHPALPRPPVGPRVRGRRGDGHRPARHGPVLVAGQGADREHGRARRRPPQRGPVRRRRLRGGHRPPRRRREPFAHPDHRRLRVPARVRAVGRRRGDPDGQPRARRRRPRPSRLPGRLRRAAEAGEPAGDPALARRGVRPGAGRLLGRRRLRVRRRDRARPDRPVRRPASTASSCRCSTRPRRSRCAAGSRPGSGSTPATTSATPT